jgi:hypothetical protein
MVSSYGDRVSCACTVRFQTWNLRQTCGLYAYKKILFYVWMLYEDNFVNPLNAELNPICHLLALLGGATIVVVSRLRVKCKCFCIKLLNTL